MSEIGRSRPEFWAQKRVLLTGHTGFKGAWTALILSSFGAEVTGLALPPENPSLFDLARVAPDVENLFADLRNRGDVEAIVRRCRPQIVLHLAAQPLVRRSFAEPVETFATNLMGTVHLLEALRHQDGLDAVLVVTTDKVYANDETGRPFGEDDRLGGHDPYAASKAAAELVVASYAASFFEPRKVPLATARGGNVIGGGDFSVDRIVPDIWRAHAQGTPLTLRHPKATRPWQHVLDCIAGYLLHVEALAGQAATTPRALNFGPGPGEEVNVAALVETMQQALGDRTGWISEAGPYPREMRRLALDSQLARRTLCWRERLPGQAAIDATAAWYKAFAAGADMRDYSRSAIKDYWTG